MKPQKKKQKNTKNKVKSQQNKEKKSHWSSHSLSQKLRCLRYVVLLGSRRRKAQPLKPSGGRRHATNWDSEEGSCFWSRMRSCWCNRDEKLSNRDEKLSEGDGCGFVAVAVGGLM
ncbi:hypothetical protein AB3S75_019586 [Citrus x aurantiifolia]